MRTRVVIVVALAVIVISWSLVPLVRGALLVRRGQALAMPTLDLVHEDVAFGASDGVQLAGTYLPANGARAVVILVHGFKNTRADMLDHARMLHDAGYATLIYDSRGCGASDGVFGVGASEDRDIIGAVTFLKDRAVPGSAHIAVLGVSLGAGDALLAAARDPRIEAVVADSSWADERVQLSRMSTLDVGPLAIPLLPYEPTLVDAFIGARLEDARPRDVVEHISPRPLLLIHSADDQNATTPLVDAQAIYAAARDPKELWVAPRGGHAGALGANRDEYRARLLSFLSRAFR